MPPETLMGTLAKISSAGRALPKVAIKSTMIMASAIGTTSSSWRVALWKRSYSPAQTMK